MAAELPTVFPFVDAIGELIVTMLQSTESVSEPTFTENVCFCRICKSLVVCYLVCLAIPLGLLFGLLSIVLFAFWG